MKSSLTKEQRQFCIQVLRRASFKWKARSNALKNARVSRGVYRCAACEEKTGPKGGNMDHIKPVVDPKHGFQNLDVYAKRLLPPESGWQWLCIKCHNQKTYEETTQRTKGIDYFKKPLVKKTKKKKTTPKKKAVKKTATKKKPVKKKTTKTKKGKK